MGTFVEGMKKNYFISAILTIALGQCWSYGRIGQAGYCVICLGQH